MSHRIARMIGDNDISHIFGIVFFRINALVQGEIVIHHDIVGAERSDVNRRFQTALFDLLS